MMRTLLHTAVLGLGLLSASVAVADEVDAMHPGLDGFRPGVGNELDSRWEPYVQQRNQNATAGWIERAYAARHATDKTVHN